MKHDEQAPGTTPTSELNFPRLGSFIGLTLRSFVYAFGLAVVSVALLLIMSYTSLGAGAALAIPLIVGLLASRIPREASFPAAIIFGTAFLWLFFRVIHAGFFIQNEAAQHTALARTLIAVAVFYGAFLSGRFAAFLSATRSTRLKP